MRLPRALVLVACAALLVPVAGVVAPAAALTATVITISGRPSPAIYHDELGPATADVVRHRGVLTDAEGTPIAGAPVELQRRLAGGEWKILDQETPTTTDDEGRYVFATYAAGNADYRVSYAGSLTYDAAESAINRIKVMRDFNAVLVEKPSKAILKGNINPGWNNKVVRWQKKKCKSCAWRVIARARTGDKGGWRFAADYPPAVGKEWFYRATIDGDAAFVESFSATLVTTRTATAGRAPAARTAAG